MTAFHLFNRRVFQQGNDIAKDLDGHAALVMMSTHRFDPSWAASGGGAEVS